MKRISLFFNYLIMLIALSLCSVPSLSQTYNFDIKAKVVKKYMGHSKGETLSIKGLKRAPQEDAIVKTLTITYNLLLDNGESIPLTERIDKALDFEINSMDDLWNAVILEDVIPTLFKNGSQTALRRELEGDVLDYLQQLKAEGMELYDPYLQDYLYTLVSKIAPTTLIDGRPGSVNIMIMDNPVLNACCYPNGTIVINTGLLAALHTEDELVAVLAHEIAHFVLDHSVQNINAEVERANRAKAFSEFIAGLAAGAEVALSVHSNGYYKPGALTVAAAATAYSISTQVSNTLGMQYNHRQENEADMYAKQALRFLEYDTNALSTALMRMASVMQRERDYTYYFSSYTHPSLMERINKQGKPNKATNADYERMVSFAVTNSAFMKYEKKRFKEAMMYAGQNIENNVGTADDYLIKANCLLALKNDDATNQEAMQLIGRAKQLEPSNMNIYKVEIITLLRMKRISEAKTRLSEYVKYLESTSAASQDLKNEKLWLSYFYFVRDELDWAKRMEVKIGAIGK